MICELFQMEVEGLLHSSDTSSEDDIVEDIAVITDYLVKKYGVLRPTTIAKRQWLDNLY